jgi:hypothetical protein
MEANVDVLGVQNDQDTASLRLGFSKPQVSSGFNRRDLWWYKGEREIA